MLFENLDKAKLTTFEKERRQETSIGTEQQRLKGIVKTEAETMVDEVILKRFKYKYLVGYFIVKLPTDAGDDESTVKTANTVRSKGLPVDIDETVVLTSTVFALNVVREFSTGEIERVDKSEGKASSVTARGEFDGGGSVLYGIKK